MTAEQTGAPRSTRGQKFEPVARAIAANKRGLEPTDSVIDKVWPAYVGQARAAVLAMDATTERVAIVAWLRALSRLSLIHDVGASIKTKAEAAGTLRILADLIERGDYIHPHRVQ